jgi:hypothetical protein
LVLTPATRAIATAGFGQAFRSAVQQQAPDASPEIHDRSKFAIGDRVGIFTREQ